MHEAIPPFPNTPPWRGDQLKHVTSLCWQITCKRCIYFG